MSSGFMVLTRPAYRDSVKHYHSSVQLEDLKESIIYSPGVNGRVVELTKTVYSCCTLGGIRATQSQ